MSKILERIETNNGYRCGCCASGTYWSEWIEEEDMLSFEELLDRAYDYNDNIDGIIVKQYERDGIVLYGYETYFSRTSTQVIFTINDKSYTIVAENLKDKKITSRAKLIQIWNNKDEYIV